MTAEDLGTAQRLIMDNFEIIIILEYFNRDLVQLQVNEDTFNNWLQWSYKFPSNFQSMLGWKNLMIPRAKSTAGALPV